MWRRIAGLTIAAAILAVGLGLVVSGIPTRHAPTEYSFNEPQSFSFGAIEVSPPATLVHTFEFVNTSSKTLRLVDVKPSCGCTNWKAQKREFAPGENGTVELDLKINGSGPTSLYADLIWSTGQTSRVTLAAMAKVPRELLISKTSLEAPAGVACEFVATYIDQNGIEPPPLQWRADDDVSVQIGPWQRLGPTETDADHATRWMSICHVTLDEHNARPVTLVLSLPHQDLRIPTVSIRTPEMVLEHRNRATAQRR